MTAVTTAVLGTLPSPTQSVWYVGPLPIRAYALFILFGILIAIQLGERRWIARGGRPGAVLDIAAWAVPFGIVGGRIYHVITSWQPYFGHGGHPLKAFYIWEGGLGIWGAVSLGGLGAWIGARRAGVRMPPMADALAPGIVLAQAIGRWGNWFNNELHGGRTDLPWGLRVYEWDQDAGHAVLGADGQPKVAGVFHPTFLYESLWDGGLALVLIWLDRRWKLGHGRVFALYVFGYTLGRGWIEALRVDDANKVLGLRVNLWTSLFVGLGALALYLWSARNRPGREESVLRADLPALPEVIDGVGSEAAPVVKSAAEAKPEPAPKTEPKVEVKPEPKVEVKPEPKVEVKPEPKVEVKPEPKVEVKPEPKVEVKPEPKAEVKPEPKAEVKPEPKADVKPAAKPDVEEPADLTKG